MRTSSYAAIILGAILPTACAVGPDYSRPEVSLPSTYLAGRGLNEGATAHEWWREFHDPLLDRAIGRALSGNLDLAQARARVDQARAATHWSGAALAPDVSMAASGGRVRSSLNSPVGEIAHAVGAPREYNEYDAGAQASWEIDLFGGLHREREAAIAEMRGSRAGESAVRLVVAAEVADAYLDLRGLQARLMVAREEEETQGRLLELVLARWREGISSEGDLAHARAQLEGIQATTPVLQTRIDGQLNRLDVLMGAPAGTFRTEYQPGAAIPAPPRPAGDLTPAGLLRRRPDVIAAEQRLVAANARIGAAVSEYYPRLSLNAAVGLSSMEAGSFFAGRSVQSGGLAGLRWRLFDFGRIDAEVAMARGRREEMLAVYRAAILRATEDVETSLSRYVKTQEQVRLLEQQVASLETARSKAYMAYAQGATALLEVIDIDKERLNAADQLALAKSEQARACVAVFRALGGGWSDADIAENTDKG